MAHLEAKSAYSRQIRFLAEESRLKHSNRRFPAAAGIASIFVGCICLVLVPQLAASGLLVSPSSITTGLRWDNVAGGSYNYTGTTLTVSGGTGPITWTIEDQNGTAVATLTSSGGKTPASIFGQIDCTGSPTNAVCVYNAPAEYPTGEAATLVATDGASSGNVSVTFAFAYNLQEYWKHRSRMLGFNNKPQSNLQAGSNPVTYQPELLRFLSAPTGGIELQIVQEDNDLVGSQFPASAGSEINRPTWSYDGKWFSWDGRRCSPAIWCSPGDDSKWIVQSDGTNLQRIVPDPVPSGFSFTYDYDRPNLLITSDASSLYAIDLDNASVRTGVAAYSSAVYRSLYSPAVGSTFQFKEPNGNSIRNAPNVYAYDLSSCERSVSPGCATPTSQWNLHLGLDFGWDDNGKEHCTFDGPGEGCEFEAHDFYLRRGSNQTVWNYGGSTIAGEGIFFQTSLAGDNTVELYPNAATNTPYLSHPAFDWTGNYALYSGPRSCMPSGYACSSDQTFGVGVWNFSTNSAAVFSGNMGFGHGAWDGFNDNVFGFDNQCTINAQAHWCLNQGFPNWTAGTLTSQQVFDFGVRDVVNSTGATAFALYYGPSQSPDATKLAESMPTSFSAGNQYEGWIAVTGTPAPPVNVTLATSASATLGWNAAALNHEAKNYHVYRQDSCAGGWTEVGSVPADYWDNFAVGQTPKQYTFADVGFSAGGTACYGISTEDWSGIEGSALSAILQVSENAGVYAATSVAGAGTTGFVTTAPGAPGSLSVSEVRISRPNAPMSLAQSSGGSLADGTYWVRVAYCNFADFPASTLPRCTGPGPASSVNIKRGSGHAALKITTAKDMFGQVGEQFYVGGPSPTETQETLQNCNGQSSNFVIVPWFPSGYPGQVNCTVAAVSAGVMPPSSNVSVLGYNLSWTPSTSSDVRYYAIYESDSEAPSLNDNNPYNDQQYLIATVPAQVSSFLDYLPNWWRIYNQSGGPFYGIMAVDREGNRSSPLCFRADTQTAVACSTGGQSGGGPGQAGTPSVTLSPAGLTFALQALNTTSPAQSVTLTNHGSDTLTIASLSSGGNFAETSTCGASLVAGASCTISVTFVPVAPGTQTGVITIVDTMGTQSIALSGSAQGLERIAGNAMQVRVGGDGSTWVINASQQIFSYDSQTQSWIELPGRLRQLSVGADGEVWGINAAGQIYRYDRAINHWDQITGALAQISVGYTGEVWGVNQAGQIYRYDPASLNWDCIPGSARQVAVGPDGSVWVINSSNGVYHFNQREQNWESFGSVSLTQIAVGYGGIVWGVNAGTGQIYRFSTATQAFVAVPGTFTQVSVGTDGTVWAIDASQPDVYRYNPNLSASFPWDVFPEPAPMSEISVGYSGAVWALDTTGDIYEYQPATSAPPKTLQAVPGSLAQLAVAADGTVWGVNGSGEIYAFNSATQNWDLINGALTQVAVGFGGAVWGINSKHQVYSFDSESQTWTLVPGLLTQIAVGSANSVWGINASGQVYQYTGQEWNLKPGLTASQIAVATDGTVWALNVHQQIYTYDAQNQSWVQVPGLLRQVAVGSAAAIWGVDASDGIYNYSTQAQQWNQTVGLLAGIGVGLDGIPWGFNSSGTVYEYNPVTVNWNLITGSTLSAIAAGADAIVWGLSGDQIYRAH